jgi:hypothetical protein
MSEVLLVFRGAEETPDGKLTDGALQALRCRVANAASPAGGFFCKSCSYAYVGPRQRGDARVTRAQSGVSCCEEQPSRVYSC